MIFGLPWFAIIPIVAILGGFIYSYKEQELKLEEKRLTSSREVNELRKIMHNLKGRIEHLEAIVAENKSQKKDPANPLKSIEVEDESEFEDENSFNVLKNKTKN